MVSYHPDPRPSLRARLRLALHDSRRRQPQPAHTPRTGTLLSRARAYESGFRPTGQSTQTTRADAFALSTGRPYRRRLLQVGRRTVNKWWRSASVSRCRATPAIETSRCPRPAEIDVDASRVRFRGVGCRRDRRVLFPIASRSPGSAPTGVLFGQPYLRATAAIGRSSSIRVLTSRVPPLAARAGPPRGTRSRCCALRARAARPGGSSR